MYRARVYLGPEELWGGGGGGGVNEFVEEEEEEAGGGGGVPEAIKGALIQEKHSLL